MSRENINPGSWGGDFGNDPLGNEYRMKQARRFDQIHAQEEARRKAAENNKEKLIIKKRQEQLADNDRTLSYDRTLSSGFGELTLGENEDDVYFHCCFDENINQAGPGDGSENAWIQKQQSDNSQDKESENIQQENPIKIRKPLRKMSFVKQSPDFSAGQAVSWMSTLRDLVENNQIDYPIIIEAIKVASELQYALAEALENLE